MSANNNEPISLAVFDMAGTTVEDTGLVEQSFEAADDHAGLSRTDADRQEMLRYVSETMGQSKIVVFRHLARGDEERAQAANKEFERCYAQLVAEGNCSPIPGAEDVITSLRARGIKTALTTGFAHETQTAILDALGWHDLADVVLCPGGGNAWPALPGYAADRPDADRYRLGPLDDRPRRHLLRCPQRSAGRSACLHRRAHRGARHRTTLRGRCHPHPRQCDRPARPGGRLELISDTAPPRRRSSPAAPDRRPLPRLSRSRLRNQQLAHNSTHSAICPRCQHTVCRTPIRGATCLMQRLPR